MLPNSGMILEFFDINLLLASSMVGRTPSPKSKRRRSTDGQSVERSDGTSQATLLEEGGEATTAGMADDEGGSAEDGITVDEHGTEWWQDDAGAWRYRTPEMNDWAIHDS